MRFSLAENLGEKSEAERFEAFEYGRFPISVRLLIGLEGGVVFRNQYQSKVINVIKAKSMQS